MTIRAGVNQAVYGSDEIGETFRNTYQGVMIDYVAEEGANWIGIKSICRRLIEITKERIFAKIDADNVYACAIKKENIAIVFSKSF